MILGIDLSLTGTGLALISNDPNPPGLGSVLKTERLLPNYWLSTACLDKVPDGTYPRWLFIVDMVMTVAANAKMIVIEGYSFGSHSAHTRAIAEIGGIVRFALMRNGHSYTEVAPTALKKFASGSSVAPKEIIILECFKRWNIEVRNNNIADAVALAMIGQALVFGTEGLPKFQQEVIESIKNPKPKKGKKAREN